MQLIAAKEFLRRIGITSFENGGTWLRASCPLAPYKHASGSDSNPSFGLRVYSDGRPSFFNCFACSSGGALDDLVLELMHYKAPVDIAGAMQMLEDEANAPPIIDDYQELKGSSHTFEPWPEWWLDSFPPFDKVPLAVAYLQSRGLDLDLCRFYDVRCDHSKGTICFPFRNRSGVLAGMRGRFVNPGQLRWYDYGFNGLRNTATTYFGEDKIDFLKPVVLVEGAIKVIATAKVYPNVMSPLSASSSVSKIKSLASSVEVICAFDPDVGGNLAAEKVARVLYGSVPVTKVAYPRTVDIDELTEVEVREMLRGVGLNV